MALFKQNFSKPGPGVPKNAPRKKGVARFFEVLARDAGGLLKLNIIYQICLLPAQVMLLLCIYNPASPLFFVFAVLGVLLSFPVGPAGVAMAFCISKMLRDDPGFILHDFKRKFKENFKSALPVGMVYSLVLGAQVVVGIFYLLPMLRTDVIFTAVFLLSVLMVALISPYYFVQAGYLELGTGQLLKNSMLLTFGSLPRSLGAMLLGGGLQLALVVLLPFSLVLYPFFGYALPSLLCLMMIWQPIDKAFNIEKILRERQENELVHSVEAETKEK